MPVLELLSPAKNKETAIAAFCHGADAVYMGARKFGARENAGNTTEEIQQVVDFAHQFGGKVYATVNTIFYSNETEEIRKLIVELWEIGVDALIIQDPGILELDLPPMRFHMSTQANNRTLEQIHFWEETGISRVVLARELSVEQIRTIREKTTIELEAFIHGALCVSYSGNCYMSADINRRSANRGNCAQPCRLPYDVFLPDKTKILEQKHILSTLDLETTSILDKLIYAGITSFKIEGRLKDISYVKNITAHYHRLLNQFISQNPQFSRAAAGVCNFDFEPDPARTFSRKTSTYFYLGRSRPLVNLITPKSMGQNIGKVIAIDGKKVTIATSEELINGDGICYISNHQLFGTNIVGTHDKSYLFAETEGLKTGTEIYRNFDKIFLRQIEKSSRKRKISVDFGLQFKANTLKIMVKCELAEIEHTFNIDSPTANNQIKAKETWIMQFAKLGETHYSAKEINIEGDPLPHVSIAEINEIRRSILEQLTQKIKSQHKQSRAVSTIKVVKCPNETIDYHWNVANPLSRHFYEKRGVKSIEDAFEISKPLKKPYVVMITKYCLLFELGKCKKETPKALQLPEPITIANKFKRYRLEFDCVQCQMLIKSIEF